MLRISVCMCCFPVIACMCYFSVFDVCVCACERVCVYACLCACVYCHDSSISVVQWCDSLLSSVLYTRCNKRCNTLQYCPVHTRTATHCNAGTCCNNCNILQNTTTLSPPYAHIHVMQLCFCVCCHDSSTCETGLAHT